MRKRMRSVTPAPMPTPRRRPRGSRLKRPAPRNGDKKAAGGFVVSTNPAAAFFPFRPSVGRTSSPPLAPEDEQDDGDADADADDDLVAGREVVTLDFADLRVGHGRRDAGLVSNDEA